MFRQVEQDFPWARTVLRETLDSVSWPRRDIAAEQREALYDVSQGHNSFYPVEIANAVNGNRIIVFKKVRSQN